MVSMKKHAGLAIKLLALVALLLVFLAYTQPALMVQLSQQLWACF